MEVHMRQRREMSPGAEGGHLHGCLGFCQDLRRMILSRVSGLWHTLCPEKLTMTPTCMPLGSKDVDDELEDSF